MKLLITGSVASGKTTLARRISASSGIPCYEGDQIAWGFTGEERYKRTDKEQAATIERINRVENWIIEGTDRKSQRVIYELAGLIIYLDTPLRLRKARIITRFIRQVCGAEHCNYRPTLDMLKHMFRWTAEFEAGRHEFEERLARYQDKVARVKSVKELNASGVIPKEWLNLLNERSDRGK